jgi:hypothetical protein
MNRLKSWLSSISETRLIIHWVLVSGERAQITKSKKEVFYSFEPFHIVIHQLLKGLI